MNVTDPSAMDTIELQYILNHGIWLNYLRGKVCSKDNLPSQKPKDVRAYIINTDNSDKTGEHWLAVFFKENQEAVYFDSYGLPPIHEDIQVFLENNSKIWTVNTQRLQSLTSTVCGQYCIFALDALAKGYDLNRYLQHMFYKDNFFKNDNSVMTWFKQNYGQIYKKAQQQLKFDTCQCCKPNQCHHALSMHFPKMSLYKTV